MTKNGLLTDTSYCNILLFDETDWITPSQPLIKGVRRDYLLDQKMIKGGYADKGYLALYIGLQLINALK